MVTARNCRLWTSKMLVSMFYVWLLCYVANFMHIQQKLNFAILCNSSFRCLCITGLDTCALAFVGSMCLSFDVCLCIYNCCHWQGPDFAKLTYIIKRDAETPYNNASIFIYVIRWKHLQLPHLCGCVLIYFCLCCFYLFKMLIIVCSVGIFAFFSCSVILI